MVTNRYLENFQILGGLSKSNRFMSVSVLFLVLIVGCSTNSSSSTPKSEDPRPRISANNSPTLPQSSVDRTSVEDQGSKTLDCDSPAGYSVEEGTDPGTNSVKIVRNGTTLHTIKLPTDIERNGFALDGVKKTKDGFEIAIEYGSRIFYGKRFIFICREHKFQLSKIEVDSFDRGNPEKWSKRTIKVEPNLPLEKFSIDDFMLEGVVQH